MIEKIIIHFDVTEKNVVLKPDSIQFSSPLFPREVQFVAQISDLIKIHNAHDKRKKEEGEKRNACNQSL